MSILISHPGSPESGQMGHVRGLAAERAGERRHALRVRLGVKRDGDAVGTATQARQLEQQVTCRLALPHCTGEPARAARARDLHLVREPFVGTYEERPRQSLEAHTGADDAVRVTPLHELPLAL